ncbi:MAG TPA: STAS domain-containing protein, partial [Candidatus Aquabacterium excrementipullorum]|nr:STAS domain-containing protein [Candidatus Aquabacterium excrementipullorum]
ADFEQCERNLMTLIQPGGPRHGQSDTWMVLFDLYRALDQQPKFDTLANAFVHQFGLSAPQWYSLPERVSRHLAARTQMVAPASTSPEASAVQARASVDSTEAPLEGWIAPPIMDTDALGRLRCEVLQLPRPWVMDWAGVEAITPEAAGLLHKQFREWAREPLQLTWIGIDRLLEVITEMSPTGNRDADPDIWMLRLELLRLANRPDQFDEAAIDYCVTYELSPPSWESPSCNVKLIRDATCTQTVSLSHIGDVSTSFVESILHDDIEFIQMASLELSGQLSGDIGTTLTELDGQLGASVAVQLDCAHLIRVDFIAAGDLLNWVLARSAEQRTVTFVNPHRLVALFFGAMGITEHAKVKLQLV